MSHSDMKLTRWPWGWDANTLSLTQPNPPHKVFMRTKGEQRPDFNSLLDYEAHGAFEVAGLALLNEFRAILFKLVL